jgi:DNA polymerase elongation subunit (family B)
MHCLVNLPRYHLGLLTWDGKILLSKLPSDYQTCISLILELLNLVVSNKISIEFEAKYWKYLFVASFKEAKHYSYLLLHHMVASKGKKILGCYH